MARCCNGCGCSIQVLDTPTINMTLTGIGTSSDPITISAVTADSGREFFVLQIDAEDDLTNRNISTQTVGYTVPSTGASLIPGGHEVINMNGLSLAPGDAFFFNVWIGALTIDNWILDFNLWVSSYSCNERLSASNNGLVTLSQSYSNYIFNPADTTVDSTGSNLFVTYVGDGIQIGSEDGGCFMAQMELNWGQD